MHILFLASGSQRVGNWYDPYLMVCLMKMQSFLFHVFVHYATVLIRFDY